MTSPSAISESAARLRGFIRESSARGGAGESFDALALELFALQFAGNPAYRRFCEARGVNPEKLRGWREIPAMPTMAFKELELTTLPPEKRTHVFHSSGTTGQQPSRHFHNNESLAVYEASLLPWFQAHLLRPEPEACAFLMLTPPPEQSPHSSLVHMFETVRKQFAIQNTVFAGTVDGSGGWEVDLGVALAALNEAIASNRPVVLLGTAFGFVHLLDHLAESHRPLRLPPGSRVLETGGYKGRSRTLPKAELHALITQWLAVPDAAIVCEYGMSELSSQAYDHAFADARSRPRVFQFPPWARVLIVSPETGREMADGETGLIRIFDLANVWSVLAVQTEDLGIRRGNGFELLGRAALAEPRGCSLQSIP